MSQTITKLNPRVRYNNKCEQAWEAVDNRESQLSNLGKFSRPRHLYISGAGPGVNYSGGGQGAETRGNKGGKWSESERRGSGMRESCEGGRREKNEGHIRFLINFCPFF